MSWLRPAGSLATETDRVHLTPDTAGWAYSGLRVVDLEPGGTCTLSRTGVETAVIPLRGGCTVEGDGFGFTLEGRSSVFEATTDLCYLPVASDAARAETVVTSVRGGRFALATARADDVRRPRYHPAGEVAVEVRGAGQATRQINGLLSADVEGPQRLIVVEVLTPGGNWSSYPPHKHDEWTETEVPLEEVYFFQVRGEHGFGLHRTYTTGDPAGDIDETVTVRSDDVFLIPRGYHGPCVAAPGYDLYYLNVMAGPDPERRWLICTDPEHEWQLGTWETASPDPRLPMYREEKP